MSRLRFLTSGESHGQALLGILEGIPSNLSLSKEDIDRELRRRQKGYGRGGRMKIEADTVEILSGVRWGKTIGSPIGLLIKNKDWENWQKGMSPSEQYKESIPPVTRPRPGHADLAGIMKYNQKDIRNILERSSARETAMRVAVGAVCKRMLGNFNIKIGSFVTSVGRASFEINTALMEGEELLGLHDEAEKSELRCPEESTTEKMKAEIDRAKEEGYSLGGRFVVFAIGVPPGLGSHIQWDRRMDGLIAQAMLSIQAIKAVEIGEAIRASESPGISVMDEIVKKGQFSLGKLNRPTNYAGGIEGGITNGMPVVLRAVMKPIPTQRKPLRSVDILTGESVEAAYERSDVCAVPAASVVAEAMLSIIITSAFLEKFGGDSLEETKRNYQTFIESI